MAQRSDVDKRSKNYAAKQRISDYELISYRDNMPTIGMSKGKVVFSSVQNKQKFWSPEINKRAVLTRI